MRRATTAFILGLSLLLPTDSLAHAEGEDYIFLTFRESSIEGHFEIHVTDLREKLGLAVDPRTDDLLRQVEATTAPVHAYIEEHFAIGPERGEEFTLEFTRQDVVELPQGAFAQYHFRVSTETLPDRLAIHHAMLYEGDRLHRGLVLVEYNAKTDTLYPGEYTALVFSPAKTHQILDLTDIPSIMTPLDMIPQGIRHIWIGIDHILFLLALMLPTVLVLDAGRWMPVARFPRAFWNLLKIVTVFTIAHSVTLVLAALDFVSLPSRLVESVIALSIVLVALNNIFRKMREGALLIILGLGLFHGLGFASVMGHLPFRMGNLLRIVVGFNIGVELGQLAIVAVLFPVLFLMRRSLSYEPLVLRGVSSVLVLISGWWFVQRSFGLH